MEMKTGLQVQPFGGPKQGGLESEKGEYPL
jgi:hypothetical protein